ASSTRCASICSTPSTPCGSCRSAALTASSSGPLPISSAARNIFRTIATRRALRFCTVTSFYNQLPTFAFSCCVIRRPDKPDPAPERAGVRHQIAPRIVLGIRALEDAAEDNTLRLNFGELVVDLTKLSLQFSNLGAI